MEFGNQIPCPRSLAFLILFNFVMSDWSVFLLTVRLLRIKSSHEMIWTVTPPMSVNLLFEAASRPRPDNFFFRLKPGNVSARSASNKKPRLMAWPLNGFCCRGGGIRTPGALQLNGFQDRRIRPLCHSSVFLREFVNFGLQMYGILSLSQTGNKDFGAVFGARAH